VRTPILRRLVPFSGYLRCDRLIDRWGAFRSMGGATLMVQDCGGPIGFAVATRHPANSVAAVLKSES
jgi:hypothetical protein